MEVYILSGARTPTGSMLGNLSTVPATELGATAIKAAVERAKLSPNEVGEVFMGLVVQAGTKQAPARQAAIFAGLPESTPCTTINKVCGSGLKSVITGAQSILCGDNDVVVAGGMENMSLAPHLLPVSRKGVKYGSTQLYDALEHDALSDVYTQKGMGLCAEECPKEYQLTRKEQDDVAIESYKRAQNAHNEGIFKQEIAPVTIKNPKGDTVVSEDEGLFKANFEKIPTLRPAFTKDGTITAANASSINDGASALVLASSKYKDQAKFKIIAWANHAHNPTMFTTAPIGSIKKVLEKANLKTSDIDIYEINEAFACVPLAAIKELNLDSNNVNIFGSGISQGHAIGSTGSKIVLSLMTALEKTNKKRGLASLCIGGGEALSIIIEKIK